MLQIQRVFSPQIHNREPFATGWWRRERNCKLTFSRQASVTQRAQASWMRFSAHTREFLRNNREFDVPKSKSSQDEVFGTPKQKLPSGYLRVSPAASTASA